VYSSIHIQILKKTLRFIDSSVVKVLEVEESTWDCIHQHLRCQKARRFSSMSQPPYEYVPCERVKSFGPTVWHEYSPLAKKYNAVNLGQGFPDFDGADFVKEAAHVALDGGASMNQYTRSGGHPRLVQALSHFYSPLFGRKIDPMEEIVTGVGASESIYATITALVGPGDEIVLMEPFFDIYLGAVWMSGATARYVGLKPRPQSSSSLSSDDWVLDEAELEAAFNSKTKVFLINNPQNPTGKVFSRSELEMIANVVKKFPHVTVISDEVYEWMVYDDIEHVRIATLPGMWERTLTVGSSGKTFSVTGWKIGWVIGPNYLIQAIMNCHQYIPFSVCTPLQEAIAIAFEQAPHRDYFKSLKEMYQSKRDFLIKALRDAGLDPVVPKGSYFILAGLDNLHLIGNEGQEKTITGQGKHLWDWNACRFLTTDVGVAAIPLSAFYSTEHQSILNYARFCFCKTDDVLQEASDRLAKLKGSKNYVPKKTSQ